MAQWAQRHRWHARERENIRRVAVDDGANMRVRAIDFRVQVSLEERARVRLINGSAVQIVQQHVRFDDRGRRLASAQEKVIGKRQGAAAHMTKAVDHALSGEHSARQNQIMGGNCVVPLHRVKASSRKRSDSAFAFSAASAL